MREVFSKLAVALVTVSLASCAGQVLPDHGGLIAQCEVMRTESGEIYPDFEALHAYSGRERAEEELARYQRNGWPMWQPVELTFSYYVSEHTEDIRIDYFNTVQETVTNTNFGRAQKVGGNTYRVRDFVLRPGSGNVYYHLSRQIDGMRQLPTNQPRAVVGDSTYVGECEFYDDLSWVE